MTAILSLWTVLVGAWTVLLISLSYCDLRRLLPNALTAPAAVLMLLLTLLSPAVASTHAVTCGALSCGGYLAARLWRPTAIGGGDVKLVFSLGMWAAWAGTSGWLLFHLLAPLLTLTHAAVAGVLGWGRRRGRGEWDRRQGGGGDIGRTPVAPQSGGGITAVAHGPALCAAAALVEWL